MRIIYVGYVSVTLYMNRPMYVSLCLYIYRLHVPACSVMFKFKDELINHLYLTLKALN